MTSKSKKTISPAFEAASTSPKEYLKVTQPPHALDTKTWDFYRASSCLLRGFLKNGFAKNINESDIGIGICLTPSNEFSMYFYLQPESSLNAEQFIELMSPFISELKNAASEDDIPAVDIKRGGTPDCPAYLIYSSDIRDMLAFSERVLAPYDMILNLCSEVGKIPSLEKDFRFDALYDLPRLRALASMALGNTSNINGLHLTH